MDATGLSGEELKHDVVTQHGKTEGHQKHGWDSGTELEVEDRGDSIVIRPLLDVPRTKLGDVVGCLHHEGSPKTVEEMERAITEGALESK